MCNKRVGLVELDVCLLHCIILAKTIATIQKTLRIYHMFVGLRMCLYERMKETL